MMLRPILAKHTQKNNKLIHWSKLLKPWLLTTMLQTRLLARLKLSLQLLSKLLHKLLLRKILLVIIKILLSLMHLLRIQRRLWLPTSSLSFKLPIHLRLMLNQVWTDIYKLRQKIVTSWVMHQLLQAMHMIQLLTSSRTTSPPRSTLLKLREKLPRLPRTTVLLNSL